MQAREKGEGNLMLRRNLFLLCARTEEECKWLSTVLAFAITTDPWRLEVDLAKSFVGVTAGVVLDEMRMKRLE